ncbi:hypothetical protein [Brevundimonas naejangsanensis]|uniref:hypothetical protein n=1 Tax=Brevundimonas naejangsanensis TaxID=588932 RepID=UPI00040DACD0|nr:hypothetical protein [Brevundimonas naejangsanensis]
MPESTKSPAEAAEWITGDQLHEIMQTFTDRADVSEIAAKINATIALRAQPPARDDAQPVAWRVEYRMPNGRMSGVQLFGTRAAVEFAQEEASQPTTVSAIYTHPAPDALRVAVEALEPFAKAGELFDTGKYQQHDAAIYSPAAGRDFNIHSGHLLKARQALAALQAEQGAK